MTDAPAVPPAPGAEPPSGASRPPRSARRESAACDALRALLRDDYLQHFGTTLPAQEALRVNLSLTVEPRNAWRVSFDPAFEDQIAEQLADAQAQRGVYRRGRVHCFRCRSSDCEHAAPPGPLDVFKGYSATGEPEWHEMVQAFVEIRDPRIDQLYAVPPLVLAQVQLGRELKARQLACFGRASRTYSVLGQVVAGYFPLPRAAERAEGGRDRLAVTFQVVETRGMDGAFHLRLNPVASGLGDRPWDELLVEERWEGIADAFAEATRAIESLERSVEVAGEREGPAGVRARLGRIPTVLQRLARSLEQSARKGVRRTRHVERRRREQRPVHKALEDARSAADEAVFIDAKRHTFVVCGPQGRAHAFSEDGRHVTSFVLPPDGADFRLRTDRWHRPAAEDIAAFRARLSARRGSEISPAGRGSGSGGEGQDGDGSLLPSPHAG